MSYLKEALLAFDKLKSPTVSDTIIYLRHIEESISHEEFQKYLSPIANLYQYHLNQKAKRNG